MRDYKKLQIWNRSYELSKMVYSITNKFPSDEKYGITSQIRRASISIPSNIAEGCSRRTKKDFAGFLVVSLGSLFELETQVHLSRDFGYIDNQDFEKVNGEINELKAMLITYIDKVYKSNKSV